MLPLHGVVPNELRVRYGQAQAQVQAQDWSCVGVKVRVAQLSRGCLQ